LAAPRCQEAHARRSLAAGAPSTPGVYLFRDKNDTVLYVGKARDLPRPSAFLLRGRPSAAGGRGSPQGRSLAWSGELGSELEASLELRLIRELRPPANARSTRPSCYLNARPTAGQWSPPRRASAPHGQAAGAARGTRSATSGVTTSPRVLPTLRRRLPRLARDSRFEDAARLRDRIAALEAVASRVAELERLRGGDCASPRPGNPHSGARSSSPGTHRAPSGPRRAPPGGSRSRPGWRLLGALRTSRLPRRTQPSCSWSRASCDGLRRAASRRLRAAEILAA
jgi:hypothetical protein